MVDDISTPSGGSLTLPDESLVCDMVDCEWLREIFLNQVLVNFVSSLLGQITEIDWNVASVTLLGQLRKFLFCWNRKT